MLLSAARCSCPAVWLASTSSFPALPRANIIIFLLPALRRSGPPKRWLHFIWQQIVYGARVNACASVSLQREGHRAPRRQRASSPSLPLSAGRLPKPCSCRFSSSCCKNPSAAEISPGAVWDPQGWGDTACRDPARPAALSCAALSSPQPRSPGTEPLQALGVVSMEIKKSFAAQLHQNTDWLPVLRRPLIN